MSTTKRLFFAFEAIAPWPEKFPKGKMTQESDRHLTIAFLGEIDYQKFLHILDRAPLPSFKVSPAGYCDKILFLPPAKPHVVAYHFKTPLINELVSYQKLLNEWLIGHEFIPHHHERPLLPHITLCRSPFEINKWKQAYSPLSVGLGSLRLYESLGNMEYETIWEHSLFPPFVEIEHTADIAFIVRGDSVQEVYNNAFYALATKEPKLLHYESETAEIEKFEDIVRHLNALISRVDSKEGSSIKAISYHGRIKEKQQILDWEMIIDV
ncbi:MAG: hypothetical protein Tsb0021_01690 [Chlamydiales bacterium]